MTAKRKDPTAGLDDSDTRICAILGNFTDKGIEIVYRDLQSQMLSLEYADHDHFDRIKLKKASYKGGKYVR